jgi:hypothetical protein
MRAARRHASVAARLQPGPPGRSTPGWHAATAGQRVTAAASHLAAVMQDASPVEADRVAETVVADLLAAAKELSEQRNRNRT